MNESMKIYISQLINYYYYYFLLKKSDVSKFIAAGRLNCVIDKVNGIVETNRPDAKNAQYQQTIKQGDILLNRVQKLSRVITV
jgi:26S proteasome regulatory subunit N7